MRDSRLTLRLNLSSDECRVCIIRAKGKRATSCCERHVASVCVRNLFDFCSSTTTTMTTTATPTSTAPLTAQSSDNHYDVDGTGNEYSQNTNTNKNTNKRSEHTSSQQLTAIASTVARFILISNWEVLQIALPKYVTSIKRTFQIFFL